MPERPKPLPNAASSPRDKPDNSDEERETSKVIKPPRTPLRPTPR